MSAFNLDLNVIQTCDYLKSHNICPELIEILKKERIDGKSLVTLCENDISYLRDKYDLKLGNIKQLTLLLNKIRQENYSTLCFLNLLEPQIQKGAIQKHPMISKFLNSSSLIQQSASISLQHSGASDTNLELHNISPPTSESGVATTKPDFFKTIVSLGYAFLVSFITAFVMVVVHERVPDMKKYPPLPDIFLDNVPHIPWAFMGCEVTGTLLFCIWACVLLVHKHRLVLLRRFFALSGTVFLLRCVTMLITSLSVPGTHLECKPPESTYNDSDSTVIDMLYNRVSRAYFIWSGLGMSIQGVRTCGDYMFSGHTVALTLLNFFITEYTPRNLYFLHTITWLLNMFGIFFILAAHEHYSIDVFVAFYISSRLFLYYHTLANNQALMSHDSTRTRIWFPMFSYFENSVDGIIPNEYDTFTEMVQNVTSYFVNLLMYVKDLCMLSTRRVWITPPNEIPKRRTKRSNSQTMSRKNVQSVMNTNLNQLVSLRRSTGNLVTNESILLNNNNNTVCSGPKKDD